MSSVSNVPYNQRNGREGCAFLPSISLGSIHMIMECNRWLLLFRHEGKTRDT